MTKQDRVRAVIGPKAGAGKRPKVDVVSMLLVVVETTRLASTARSTYTTRNSDIV